ncbi:calmodulin-beta-like [Pecten maximus]|uniref:calmodulin-beta-like n=1 Tax=Pecten maximus TaxID=6579 RepID=UPI0014582676|nr:calmodulin-beta-like [Pecten maximus]
MSDQKEADELSITVEELKAYRTAFKYCDVDGSGTISLLELKQAMQLQGASPTDEEMEKIIADFDDNGNGLLEFDEFVKLMESRNKTTDDLDELAFAFRTFDKDGNGVLDSRELKIALTSLGEVMTEAEVEDLIKSASTTGGRYIDFKDFITLITGKPLPEEYEQQLQQQQQQQPEATKTMGANQTV